MDKDIDARFERVEKALDRMIESLAKNNPSEKLTEDLVAAEAELAEGFKLLEIHQNNYARIVQLRNETAQLDAQLKDILSSTWSMRNELKSVPVTTNPQEPTYQFTAAELLSNAQHISRNTRPPPGVTNGVDMNPTPAGTQQEPDDSFRLQSQSQTQTPTTSFNLSFTNGAATPLPGPDNPTATTQQPQPPAQPQPFSSQQSGATSTTLPDHLQAAVNPLHNATFHPWPTADRIRLGALAEVQRLSDRGIPARGYDPAAAEAARRAEEQARKEAEERARQEREAAERRAREEREQMARERERARQRAMEEEEEAAAAAGAGVGGGQQPQQQQTQQQRRREEPKQFTFLGGDDDDDDDEDDG